MYGEILARWKKGQMWSYDLVIGSVLFMIAMAILAFFWWSARTNISENKDAVIFESMKVSDSLMSPGTPANWESLVDPMNMSTWANVQQIGLAKSWGVNETNVISIDKLYKFRQMSLINYSYTKSKLRSRYDFFIELKIRNSSQEERAKLNGTDFWAGRQYNEFTMKTLAKTDRVVIYNNSVAIMRLYLWSDSLWD